LEGIIEWSDPDHRRNNEKAAVHPTVGVFIVECIRSEQRRFVGKKAVKDYQPTPDGNARIGFTRDPQAAARGEGIYSPTGSWGDPTLATREKGRIATKATIAAILKQIETLRQAVPPNPGAAK
jgi:hypothetical protein